MSLSELEQGSRSFIRQCRNVDLLSPFPALILTLSYLVLLFEPERFEKVALTLCLVGSGIVAGLISEAGRRRQIEPIARYLDQNSSDDLGGIARADAPLAFHAIVSLPQQMQRTKFLACAAPMIMVPPLMWVLGFDAWLSGERVRSLATISFVVSLISGILLFYVAKQRFGGLRRALASVSGDPDARTGLITRYSFARKMMLVVTVPAFASLLLVVDVVNENMHSSAENEAVRWAAVAVELVASSDTELSLPARVVDELPREEFWPVPVEFIEIRTERRMGDSVAGVSRFFLDALDRQIGLGQTSGIIMPSFGNEIGAFRKLEHGKTLVSKVLRSDLDPAVASLIWAVGIVGLGVVGAAFLIGRLAAVEVNDRIKALDEMVKKMATRNLDVSVVCESEDELGDLGRSLVSVGEMFRSTILRASNTAERVDRVAASASAVLDDLVTTSAKQDQQIKAANREMVKIVARMEGTSQSTAKLDSTIDESATALLDLGAIGDELNETASVLTSKVDAMSNSLEQMVRSTKQVAGSSDRLAAASEETSTSMENMASAMRAVDIAAETTANLSREVVSKAELGQAKVVQTIEGMEAIRDATDVAEKVIRGLGARTNEIGGILDVIDDVADETNLLALNAAIIAAQAGEHGKAFSVVAEEIKELADRVLASTKEIGGLIRAVQYESENAIGAIEAGSASVMSGVDLSAEAGRTLEEITVASRESGLRITEIVGFVREQTKAASHVVDLMEKVRESADQIEAAGRQQEEGNEIVNRSAVTMRDVAIQVHRTTESQAAGFNRIRENVGGVREAVAQIMNSVGEQATACHQVAEQITLVSLGLQSNEETAEKMREMLREFVLGARALREDVERFRV